MTKPNNPYGVRFTTEEIDAIDGAAKKAGLTRHVFIRIAALVLAGAAELPEQLQRLRRKR